MFHSAPINQAYVSEAELLTGNWTPEQYSAETVDGRSWGCMSKERRFSTIEQWCKLQDVGAEIG